MSESDRERQTPYDFTYMHDVKNKINDQTKPKQSQRHRYQAGDRQREGGFGELGGKGEGIKKCKLVVTRGLWDMKYGIGSRVKNMVITVRSVGRVLDYWGDHFINHVNV